MCRLKVGFSRLLWLALAASTAVAQTPTPVFDVPRLDGIRADGDARDWGDAGYPVDDIRRYGAPGPTSIRPDIRLAWDMNGLLILARIDDNMWAPGDGLELSLSARRGDPNILQWTVYPGGDSADAKARCLTRDLIKAPELRRQGVDPDFAAVRSTVASNGFSSCTYEVRLDWSSLGIIPAEHREVALQIAVLDADGGGAHRNVWFQGRDLHMYPDQMQRIRLRRSAGHREIFQVSKYVPNPSTKTITLGIVRRGSHPAGPELIVTHDGRELARVRHTGGRRDLQIPLPPLGAPYTNLLFVVDGDILGGFALNTDESYFENLERRRLTFPSHVFAGDRLPECDFVDKAQARQAVPDYEVTVRYFDASFNEVTHAAGIGRYGAIVTYGNKAAFRTKHVTLYRVDSEPDLCTSTGISPEIVATHRGAIEDALRKRTAADAILLAILRDRSDGTDGSAFISMPEVREDQWWATLRHKLGEDATAFSPHPFAVITPQDYERAADRRFGLLIYCPGREFDCDGTWQGVARHPATRLFRGPQAVPCPFIVCVPHSYNGYTPEDLLHIIDVVSLQYRVDPHKVFAVGKDSDADAVRMLAARYPARLAAVVQMKHGGAIQAMDLSGTAGDEAVYSRRGRDAELAEPPNPISPPGYAWLAALSKPLPGEAIRADPLPPHVRRIPPPAGGEPVPPAKFVQALKAGTPQKIVALGTSLTSGGAWVEQLKAEFEKRFPGLVTVLNFGASGRNGGHGLQSSGAVIASRADVVLIEYSMNDAKDGQMALETSRAILEETISRIQTGLPECEIIPMTMNNCGGGAAERRPLMNEFYQVYRDVAKERGLRCIDHYRNWIRVWEENPDLYWQYIPDGCHPAGIGCSSVITPEILRAIGL